MDLRAALSSSITRTKPYYARHSWSSAKQNATIFYRSFKWFYLVRISFAAHHTTKTNKTCLRNWNEETLYFTVSAGTRSILAGLGPGGFLLSPRGDCTLLCFWCLYGYMKKAHVSHCLSSSIPACKIYFLLLFLLNCSWQQRERKCRTDYGLCLHVFPLTNQDILPLRFADLIFFFCPDRHFGNMFWIVPDWTFPDSRASNSADRRFWTVKKFANFLISRLQNCEQFGQVQGLITWNEARFF